jgi:hypothetical protein
LASSLRSLMAEVEQGEIRGIIRVRTGGVSAGLTTHTGREACRLGGRSGENEGEQGGHECAKYVRKLVTGAG